MYTYIHYVWYFLLEFVWERAQIYRCEDVQTLHEWQLLLLYILVLLYSSLAKRFSM